MRAVLDACVIYPSILRDILIGFAAKGLFEPVLSDRIVEEWTRSTAKIGPEAQALAKTEAMLLRANFPNAFHRVQPQDEAGLSLPDPNDVHVLAVAIASHADCIVTFNAQDFPRPILAEHDLDRRDPDGFLWEIASHHPSEAKAVTEAVLAKAEKMAGETIGIRRLLKKVQLNRLAKFLADPKP